MPFLVFIHRRGKAVPHFEVLGELTERDAQVRAARLLAQRADGVRAEVWDGDKLVLTVPRAAAPEPTAP